VKRLIRRNIPFTISLNDFFYRPIVVSQKWEESRRGLTRPYFSFIHSSKRKERLPPPFCTDWQREREWEREFEGEGKRKAGILIDAFWKGASAAGVPASKVLQHFHVLRSARSRSLGGKTESAQRRGHLTRKAFGIKTAFFTNLQFIPRDEEKQKKNTTGCLRKKGSERERGGRREEQEREKGNGRGRFLLFKTF